MSERYLYDLRARLIDPPEPPHTCLRRISPTRVGTLAQCLDCERWWRVRGWRFDRYGLTQRPQWHRLRWWHRLDWARIAATDYHWPETP